MNRFDWIMINYIKIFFLFLVVSLKCRILSTNKNRSITDARSATRRVSSYIPIEVIVDAKLTLAIRTRNVADKHATFDNLSKFRIASTKAAVVRVIERPTFLFSDPFPLIHLPSFPLFLFIHISYIYCLSPCSHNNVILFPFVSLMFYFNNIASFLLNVS